MANLETELRLYQVEAAKDLLDKKKVVIADEMGLGKTAEALIGATAIENRQSYEEKKLIVCPASVAQHWEDEIKKWYKKKENTIITKIQTHTYGSDIKEIEKENPDFVIIAYPTLSSLGKKDHEIDRLRELNFQYGIVDEVHNAKNPESIRSMAVKKLFDSMDYLALLSGTPVPNSIIDMYMLLSLLDKEQFPIDQTTSKAILRSFYTLFRRDPEAVSELLNSRMIRRTANDYLNIPELRQTSLEVNLTGEHKDAYMQVYENNNIRPAAKLMQLIKASIDPNLIDPRFLDKNLALRHGKLQSNVYSSLDDLIEPVVDNKGKVLVFSNLKEGVTDRLKERYKKYGAEVIDSEVTSFTHKKSISEREEIRRKFQRDPDCKVLIATTVMNEGVDLTAATDVVHLTFPYTPSEFDQRSKRSQRVGEIKKDYVNVHDIRPNIDTIPIITEGIQNLLGDKRRIIDYILNDPLKITYQDLQELKDGKPIKSRHLKGRIDTPAQTISRHLGSMKRKGWKEICNYYEKNPDEAELIARLYANYWEGYYAGNTANLYSQLIKLLEEKEKLERKLDIASGPFSLSRKIKEPVTNLDLNEHMLNAGKVLEQRGEIVSGNIAKQGYFHDLPFEKESFDLAVCSLALHTSRLSLRDNKKEVRERESALREANRVLRKEGCYIITLPDSRIVEGDLENFHDGLKQLGFQILPFSGFYKSKENPDFKVYMAALKKLSDPCENNIENRFLTWEMDREPLRIKRSSRKEKKHPVSIKPPKDTKKEVLNEFYHTRTQKSLEDFMKEK